MAFGMNVKLYNASYRAEKWVEPWNASLADPNGLSTLLWPVRSDSMWCVRPRIARAGNNETCGDLYK